MLFFYIRHGDPVYGPQEQLTPLGHRQAEAVAKRLALYGLDEIYASPLTRAKQTAQPTCELLKKEMTVLDFTSESLAWKELTVKKEEGGVTWLFQHAPSRALMTETDMLTLGQRWFDHPAFAAYVYEKGVVRIQTETDKFFAGLGYEHIPGTAKYKVTADSDKRIALFAHQGFGLAFLSSILNIPYPIFCMHFDMGHTGMTVIEFKNEDGICMPRVLTLADDAHLYREGLPTKYENNIYF